MHNRYPMKLENCAFRAIAMGFVPSQIVKVKVWVTENKLECLYILKYTASRSRSTIDQVLHFHWSLFYSYLLMSLRSW